MDFSIYLQKSETKENRYFVKKKVLTRYLCYSEGKDELRGPHVFKLLIKMIQLEIYINLIKSSFEYLCVFLWTTLRWLRRLGGQWCNELPVPGRFF